MTSRGVRGGDQASTSVMDSAWSEAVRQCAGCRELLRLDIGGDIRQGLETHRPHQLGLMTVTGPSLPSPLENSRWNVAMPKLRAKRLRKIRRVLPSGTPFAWVVAFQQRGVAHGHFTYAPPYEASARRLLDGLQENLVRPCQVSDSGESVDTETGEISPFEFTHAFGVRSDFQVIDSGMGAGGDGGGGESVGYYLGENAVEYLPYDSVLYEVAKSLFDASSAQKDKYGFGGPRFRTSRGWGARWRIAARIGRSEPLVKLSYAEVMHFCMRRFSAICTVRLPMTFSWHGLYSRWR